jgi:hypothetical protein
MQSPSEANFLYDLLQIQGCFQRDGPRIAPVQPSVEHKWRREMNWTILVLHPMEPIADFPGHEVAQLLASVHAWDEKGDDFIYRRRGFADPASFSFG